MCIERYLQIKKLYSNTKKYTRKKYKSYIRVIIYKYQAITNEENISVFLIQHDARNFFKIAPVNI